MIHDDFSIEIDHVEGHPVQTFRKRFTNVWEMFSECSLFYKDRVFLVEGSTRLTFRETADLAAGMAATLRETMGVGPGDHVGILMENSIRFIVAFWAIQNCGATAVVFNTRLAVPELERQLRFSDLKVLLSSPVMTEKIQSIPSDSLHFQRTILDESWRTDFPAVGRPSLPEGLQEDDPALILFTSGTTGTPKGVMITHRNLITSAMKGGYVVSQYPELQGPEAQTIVVAAPLFHVLALQEQMISGVFLGRTCVLLPTFNPEELLALFLRERVNCFSGTPTLYWMLLNKTSLREARLDSVRLIAYGGAPMPPDLLTDLRLTFPGVICLNGYGLTEASVISLLPDRFCELRPTSVGQPSLCSEIKIVDPEGSALGPGVVGELAVRGALVSKGYYKLPEETAATYREGWFHTGDLAYRDAEGFIYLVGRTKEMINRGGENVYPVEVENIIHLHPKVFDGAVFGMPDPVMGGIVACAVVPRPGVGEIGLQEVQDFCKMHLADYKIPQKIFLVPDLPRNPGGKVIKRKLIEQCIEADKAKT